MSHHHQLEAATSTAWSGATSGACGDTESREAGVESQGHGRAGGEVTGVAARDPRAASATPWPLRRFASASSKQLSACALQRRRDTKFIFSHGKLDRLLQGLSGGYAVLPAAGQRIATYTSLYFDTAELGFYEEHRRGKRTRTKVRIRHYIDRQLSFLEVKRKNNHNITEKTRRQRSYLDNTLSETDRDFLAAHARVDAETLRPQLWTNFQRITLIGVDLPERITLDVHLQYRRGSRVHSLDGLVIAEVKQPRFSARSPAMLVLRSLDIRPFSASKYCTAVISLVSRVRCNRFLPVLRRIRSIEHA